MANAMRILYVSGEVAPFTADTETSLLVRQLPELISESGDFETRIMMPRYGTISERKNRLHEVIRLSGAEIPIDGETETLKVKVASIPGIRLQVYFMDNKKLFKRKGIAAGKDGKPFADNPQRALFFSRAVLETIRKLGWGPDVVHAFGWMSGYVPLLLKTEFADEPLFENVKVVYTPDEGAVDAALTAEQAEAEGWPAGTAATDEAPTAVGAAHADALLYPPSATPDEAGALQFDAAPEAQCEQAAGLYEQMLAGVPA